MSLETVSAIDTGVKPSEIKAGEAVKEVQRRFAAERTALGLSAAIMLDRLPPTVNGGDLTRVLNFAASLVRSGLSRRSVRRERKSNV